MDHSISIIPAHSTEPRACLRGLPRLKGALIFLCALAFTSAASALTINVPAPQPGGPSALELIRQALATAQVARREKPDQAITIRLAPAIYRLETPLILSQQDSGREGAPLIIEGTPGGQTRILGSVPVELRAARVEDHRGSLPAGSSAMILDLENLTATYPLGVVARGAYSGTPVSRFELFQDDRRLRVARWPEQGYVSGLEIRRGTSDQQLRVRLPAAQFERFKADRDLLVGGYWIADWAYESQPVTAIQEGSAELVVRPLAAPLPARATAPLHFLNATSALTRPGTFVLNSEAKRAFVLPVAGLPANFEVAVARELLAILRAQHITIRHVSFERSLGTPIRIDQSSSVTIDSALVRNSGSRGIAVIGGRSVRIVRTVVADIAETGILLSGGDRPRLIEAGHSVEDSIIVRFAQDQPTYRPGVELQGVGNRVTGSLLRAAPHSAIVLSGNEHRVEKNEIADVLWETNDAGAIYMGRDFTARGNVFRGNFIHGIGDPSNLRRALIGIYLDDQFSGTTVSNNVFFRVNVPVQVGGGRDNLVEGNAFLLSQRSSVLFDDRGENKHREMTLSGELDRKLKAMPFRQPPWSTRYPTLANLPENRIGSPLGNVVRRNLQLGRVLIEYETASSRPYLTGAETVELTMPLGINPNSGARFLLNALATQSSHAGVLAQDLADRASVLRDLPYAMVAGPDLGIAP